MLTENTTNSFASTAPRSIHWETFEDSPTTVRIDRPEVFSGRNAVNLRIELGRIHVNVDEMKKLRAGAIVSLESSTSDTVAIYADEQLIARGEILDVDGKFGVRIVELVSHLDGDH